MVDWLPRPAADCTQSCRSLRMHIARIFPPISVAEVTWYLVSAGTHDYSNLVASLPRSAVWGCLVETREPVPRTKDLIRLLSREKFIVAVCRGEGDVGFRAVIALPPKISFGSRFSMLEIRRGQV